MTRTTVRRLHTQEKMFFFLDKFMALLRGDFLYDYIKYPGVKQGGIIVKAPRRTAGLRMKKWWKNFSSVRNMRFCRAF